jgi:hypothetical protein
MAKELKIQPEEVIVNLLQIEKKSFIEVSEIIDFGKYVVQQLREGSYLGDQEVFVNINFDSIERTVQYNGYIFDLFDNKIYLRQTMPEVIIRQNEILYCLC